MPVFSILNSWIQPQKPIHGQMYFRKSLSAWHQQPWWISEKSKLLWIFDFLPLSKLHIQKTVSIIKSLCTFAIQKVHCLMTLLVLDKNFIRKKIVLAKYLPYAILWLFNFITVICLMQILGYFSSIVPFCFLWAKKLQ